MTGIPSAIGWGIQDFGFFPFGHADWAEAALIPLVPEFYRSDDGQAGGRQAFPLLTFLRSLKPGVNYIDQRWVEFPKLWDADETPLEQIRLLASSLGAEISVDKPDVFQRLEIVNLPQFIVNKGTDLGYNIIGAFEGLGVVVTGLYAETCEPDAALTEEGPDAWVSVFDDVFADVIPVDEIYDDRFATWPLPLFPIVSPLSAFLDEIPLDVLPLDAAIGYMDGRCRAHTIRLAYARPDDTEIEDYNNVTRRVIGFIERVRPLHVTIESVTFDGPKASVTWIQSVVADSSAAASWVVSSIEMGLASATWVANINI